MTGREFYRTIQAVAHYEEKFSKIMNEKDFDGGKSYTLYGFDIMSIRDLCRDIEKMLDEIEIGVKA